jgi:2-haloacid dehalogenase
MTTAKIKAVLFDAYGTLFDVYSVSLAAEKLFPGHGARFAEIWRDRQIDYTRLRTLSDQYKNFWDITADALDFTAARLGLSLTPEARVALLSAYETLTPFPENIGALKQLRAHGLPLGILTNGNHSMIAGHVRNAGMDDLFDHILSVEAVRKFKTAPEAYQLGPDAFGLPAHEILFVSSNNWDACAATWFGYQTFWVNRANALAERLGVEATAIGKTLNDVVQFLQT